MKDQGDLDKRPRLPGKINDHRPRQKADSWKKLMEERERTERNRLRARNRMISGLARDFVRRCIQFDIHQYLTSSRVFCIADKLSEAANLQTAFSRTEEDNDRQLLELHVPILPSRLKLHTRRSASLSVHTCYFSKENFRSQESSLVFDTIDIPLSPFRSSEIVVRSLREV